MFSPALPIDTTGESTRIVRSGFLLVFIFLGGFLVWGYWAPISGAVIAEGVIKVDFNRKTVQHLEGGIIREILIREGNFVEQGQPLITLDDTTSSSNLNILLDQLDAHHAKEARLLAERTLSDHVTYPAQMLERNSAKVAELIKKENELFASRKATLKDSQQLIRVQIEQAKSAIAGYQSEIRAIEEGIGFGTEQLTASEALLNKHYIDKTQYWELKRLLADKKERLGSQSAELAKGKENVARLEQQLLQLKNDYIQQADNELKEITKAINEADERSRPATENLKRQTIKAPIAGQVINLRVFTVGGVIKAGDPVLDIVPQSQQLMLEVKIKPQDIDSVFLGQTAEIQLSAYNLSSTPLVPGTVAYVSGDAILDEGSNPPQYSYRTHIKVDSQALEPLKNIALAPGMPVVAFLQTPSKTFLEYLSSPVIDRMRHAFRDSQ